MFKKIVAVVMMVTVIVMSGALVSNAYAMSKTLKTVIGVACLLGGGYLVLQNSQPTVSLKQDAVMSNAHDVTNGNGMSVKGNAINVDNGVQTISYTYPNAGLLVAGMGLMAVGGGFMFMSESNKTPVIGFQTKF